MKNLILKTVAITVGALFCLIAVIYGVFALFFPKNLAAFYNGLGDYFVATRLMERGYNKSGDIIDLETLCTYAIKTEDNRLIDQHLSKLFENNDYKEYCIENNKTDYYDFLASKYASNYYMIKEEKVIAIDKAFLLTDNYLNGTALYTVVRLAVSLDADGETVDYLIAKLTEMLPGDTDQESQLLEQDILILQQYSSK